MTIHRQLNVVERAGKVIARRKNVDTVVSTNFDHAKGVKAQEWAAQRQTLTIHAHSRPVVVNYSY